jgi:hypothetical protein
MNKQDIIKDIKELMNQFNTDLETLLKQFVTADDSKYISGVKTEIGNALKSLDAKKVSTKIKSTDKKDETFDFEYIPVEALEKIKEDFSIK